MAAAAATTTLKIGSGITLVAQHDPIWLAKQVASVDVLSQGRLIFGIGYGWNKEEMAQHGVSYQERRALLREKILMMKELWTGDEASYAGELLHLDPSWAWPKPLQKPHPPIILGGAAGPKTRAHIVEFCDGWMPLYGRHSVVDMIAALEPDCARRRARPGHDRDRCIQRSPRQRGAGCAGRSRRGSGCVQPAAGRTACRHRQARQVCRADRRPLTDWPAPVVTASRQRLRERRCGWVECGSGTPRGPRFVSRTPQPDRPPCTALQ